MHPTDNEPRAKRAKTERASTPHLLSLDHDTFGVILDFLSTHDWIQFSYTCRTVNALKYVKALMIHKQRTLRRLMAGEQGPYEDTSIRQHFPEASPDRREILASLSAAKGTLFNVSFKRFITYITVRVDPYCSHEKLVAVCDIDDSFLAPLAGTIHTLDLTNCVEVTDTGFASLEGIHTLKMGHTIYITSTLIGIGVRVLRGKITDAGFKHLAGIRVLDMAYCSQETITDKAFEHLRGIHTLIMSYCLQDTITDEAFEHLEGIRYLDMSFCSQRTITSRAFDHLSGAKIEVVGCRQIANDIIFSLQFGGGVWKPQSIWEN
jgi:hypothetical protein